MFPKLRNMAPREQICDRVAFSQSTPLGPIPFCYFFFFFFLTGPPRASDIDDIERVTAAAATPVCGRDYDSRRARKPADPLRAGLKRRSTRSAAWQQPHPSVGVTPARGIRESLRDMSSVRVEGGGVHGACGRARSELQPQPLPSVGVTTARGERGNLQTLCGRV